MSANRFDVTGKVAVVTGGYGVLGGCLARGLAAAGARVAVLGRRRDRAQEKAEELRKSGAESRALVADVRDRRQVEAVRDELLRAWDRVDILVNAAGGNVAAARSDDRPVFEGAPGASGEAMAARGAGCIVNISSMAALRVLSGVLGYSIAKAGVESLTRWLAVDLARRYGDGIRVNAIAPGFFVTDQNRGVLLHADGSPTERAQNILAHTPMGRFGRPEELVGSVLWLCSDAASFVTGAVIPIDGGFSVASGV